MSVSQNYPIINPSLSLDFANTKKLDPRVTFARASTATYYDGKTVAKAEENLFQYSQEFGDSYWTKDNLVLTSNVVVAPDGTTTAEKIAANTTNSFHRIFKASLAQVGSAYTFSIFIKSDGAQWIGLRIQSVQSFDILNGVKGTGTVESSIQDFGNGWYRCTITQTPSVVSSPIVQLADSDTSAQNPTFIGDGTSGVFIWGAQLEQRSTVTAYTPTTTQPITNYIPTLLTAPANVARFEHNPVTGESLGLEVEEQRTNLLTYSEDFSDASWLKAEATVQSNVIVAADGTLTGDKLVESPSTAAHNLYKAVTTLAGVNSYSCYIKASGKNFVQLYLGGGTSAVSSANFDLLTGTVGTIFGTGVTASITNVGNGTYRCTLNNITTGAGVTYVRVVLITSSTSTRLESYTGDGYSGIYIWGAQLEAGAFPTSYIKTVASQVTRAADSASMTGSNFSEWYAQGQGTLYVENFVVSNNFSNSKSLQLNDGTISNEIWLGAGSPSTNARSQITLGGTGVFDSSLANQVIAGQYGKYALSFKTDSAVLCANSTLGVLDTAVTIPSSINRLVINPPQKAGCYKKIAYYPIAVTSAQLQGLTS